MSNIKPDIIYGINPLLEALKSQSGQGHNQKGFRPLPNKNFAKKTQFYRFAAQNRRILNIYILKKKRNKKIDKIIAQAKSQGIKFKFVDLKTFQDICPWNNHQGVAGVISSKELVSVEEMINISFKKEPNPALVVLDHIEDPRNLGSIIRSAEILGIRGVIIPKDRAADLSPVVSKTSAGALEYMLISRVPNILNTIRLLKDKGFWLIGAKEGSTNYCYTYDFKRPVALILGGEGKGFRPVIEKKCDEIIAVPQSGRINSLNVSCAAAILFYEILKQKNKS